ncbi:SMI1/KNR4 family protein [Salmonella enterica]|uniref:SMI1/KNR4 family protein n=1 Tax=Salmonella enterica TaxID=28901 RepID=UPI0009AAD793|nr:SMI1/KNR4 family protein [Salmonella enterica]HBC0155117.1 SMI1/KNR4 family protein [Salmonella enterica subsp. indica]
MKNINKLQTESILGEKTQINEFDFSKILSDKHIDFLKKYDGAISFPNGAKFKIPGNKKPQICDNQGRVSVDLLYGLGTDSYSLSYINNNKPDELQDVIIIGEALNGDFICIMNTNGHIYYWYHEAVTVDESFFFLSTNFCDFLASLEPNNELDPDIEKRLKGIVKCNLRF